MTMSASSTLRDVNVCVAGVGHWGRNLARNFHEIGHLYALCETSESLLGGAPQLAILHDRTLYFLRQTRYGKLILTK